jgi:TolA-binding protein
MRTAKSKKRIARKELKRDPFVDRVFDWALWSRENVRTVAVIAGALALVVLAVVLYRASQTSQSRQAAQRYDEVLATYYSGNYQLAANDLRQFRSQYRGSRQAAEATIYLADAYLRAGDNTAGIQTLGEFQRDFEDSPYSYAAANLLGAAYEASGDWVKASESYARAFELARHDFEKVEALLNRARAEVAQGNTDEAADAYRQIIEKYPESKAVDLARVRLAEVSAKPIFGEKADEASAAGQASSVTNADQASPSGASEEGASGPGKTEPSAEAEPSGGRVVPAEAGGADAGESQGRRTTP